MQVGEGLAVNVGSLPTLRALPQIVELLGYQTPAEVIHRFGVSGMIGKTSLGKLSHLNPDPPVATVRHRLLIDAGCLARCGKWLARTWKANDGFPATPEALLQALREPTPVDLPHLWSVLRQLATGRLYLARDGRIERSAMPDALGFDGFFPPPLAVTGHMYRIRPRSLRELELFAALAGCAQLGVRRSVAGALLPLAQRKTIFKIVAAGKADTGDEPDRKRGGITHCRATTLLATSRHRAQGAYLLDAYTATMVSLGLGQGRAMDPIVLDMTYRRYLSLSGDDPNPSAALIDINRAWSILRGINMREIIVRKRPGCGHRYLWPLDRMRDLQCPVCEFQGQDKRVDGLQARPVGEGRRCA